MKRIVRIKFGSHLYGTSTPASDVDFKSVFLPPGRDILLPEDGNRAARKDLDRLHIAKSPAQAKTIKLADLIDNTRSIRHLDPDFWRVYRREKQRVLAVLTEGDPALWARAAAECELEAP